tara:strand:+ start:19 stop:702 length:684 start_codon:yes stop_codon:yes gene_type:complete
MDKELKNTDKMVISAAIDMMAANPGIKQTEIAKKLGLHNNTLSKWMTNPDIVDKVYKRYMQIAGNELPAVIQATIEEAKLGNVHAARLVLEHFGKLENKLKIQIESNFEKFMKVGDDTEEAEFFEVTPKQEEVLDELSDKNIVLPERHVSNDVPKVRDSFEKERLSKKVAFKRKIENEKTEQSKRYLIRKRAKAVGLDLLPPGRHSKSERNAWMKELERLEAEKLNS